MDYSNIIYEKSGKIARITLNRPHCLNAINPALLTEMKDALKKVAKEDSVAVVVLTGAGRAFSAGVDVKCFSGGDQKSSTSARQKLALEVIGLIENLDKVVIAAVNGCCLTGALEIATACDMIVASENATFGDTHARFGLVPHWGGSQRLPRIVGKMKAKEMAFTCEMLTAREAQQIGLINKVAAPDKLYEAVEELAGKVMANSMASIRLQKSLINRGFKMDYASGLKMERDETSGQTADCAPRLRSFNVPTKMLVSESQ